MFKKIISKYNDTNLVLRILIGIVIGAILGLFFPKLTLVALFGDVFVATLKAIAPVLVFVLVLCAITNSNSSHNSKMRTVIALYLFSTFLASLCAVGFSFLFPQKLVFATSVTNFEYAPQVVGDVMYSILDKIFTNPIKCIIEGYYLGIIFWSVLLGLSLRKIANLTTKNLLSDFSSSISKVVCQIINLAPFGIMGLVFATVCDSGATAFLQYAKVLGLLVVCMFFVYFVTNPLIVFATLHKNPYPLILQCFRESGITAFFTRSSAANIPVNLALCEKLKLDEQMYSVSIPLGATINMSGAAVTIAIMSLAAANTLGVAVSFPVALLLSLLATLCACGASGVTGGSLLLIPLACSLLGIGDEIAMQVVGIGFIIGVIQDGLETALNSSSDVIFTATAQYLED